MSLCDAIDLDEDVAFFESGAFGCGMFVILADVGGDEPEVIACDGFEFHASADPGTDGPGAGAAGDVGLESPVFGKSESDEFDGASAFDGEEEGVFVSEVVECPSEVSGRNEGCFVGGDTFVAGFETGFGGGGVGLDFSDSGAVVLGEGEADGFRCGHGVAETEGDVFFLVVVD